MFRTLDDIQWKLSIVQFYEIEKKLRTLDDVQCELSIVQFHKMEKKKMIMSKLNEIECSSTLTLFDISCLIEN